MSTTVHLIWTGKPRTAHEVVSDKRSEDAPTRTCRLIVEIDGQTFVAWHNVATTESEPDEGRMTTEAVRGAVMRLAREIDYAARRKAAA